MWNGENVPVPEVHQCGEDQNHYIKASEVLRPIWVKELEALLRVSGIAHKLPHRRGGGGPNMPHVC